MAGAPRIENLIQCQHRRWFLLLYVAGPDRHSIDAKFGLMDTRIVWLEWMTAFRKSSSWTATLSANLCRKANRDRAFGG
jgi:hypothetical protein